MNQQRPPYSQMPEMKLPNLSGRTIGSIILGVAILAAAISSLFTIRPEEVGVVLTLGKYTRTTEPGLHLRAPFGIEKVYKVPVRRQLKEEFGFRTVQAGQRTQYSNQKFAEEELMLTGDLNCALVEWIVQYKITDPVQFLFRVRSPRDTFRDMTEAVMRSLVGDRSVNEVLTVGREEIASELKIHLQELCNQYETGIDVQVVVLQDVNPPTPVQPSFNEVNTAIQEKEKTINEALADYNQAIPRARGEAQATILAAEGYALDRVNRSRGDVERFISLLTEYKKAPDVTRRRLYLETMNEVLNRMDRKVILDDELKNVLPLLQLGEGRVNG